MSQTPRQIRVEALTRVEGEGGLDIHLHDGQIDRVQLRIFEPPRLFEALLRGRPVEDVPDITARICGICPVAYQMSAVHAIEQALGVTIPRSLRQLRRLLYCGEWIESHALHIHLLNLPDFLGYPGSIELAQDQPEPVKRGLRLRKHGNQLLDILGGRAIHPINVSVGGFFRAPSADQLRSLIPDFEWGLSAAIDSARWIAGLEFPDFQQPYDFVALTHPDEYPLCEGMIKTSDGLTVSPSQFTQFFKEVQVAHSTAMQALRTDTGCSYLLGPLARINLCRDQLMPQARQLADQLLPERPCCNPFKAIVARSLELVHAYEEGLELLRGYRPPRPSRVAYRYCAGEGFAATEAPRGLLYHGYRIDSDGKVLAADIVPPTSQNQAQIEVDLRAYLPLILELDDQRLAEACEKLVRCYDPCISCSTHFLKVRIERR